VFPRWLFWPIFAGVMGLIIGGSFVASSGIPLSPPNCQSEATKSARSGEACASVLDRFWNWTTKDAVAFYTSILALFTGVLGASTIGLWIATNRNARIAERALTEHERPWLFLESASVKMRDPETMTVIRNNWFIKLRFKNVGRAPAVVTDCLCKINAMKTLGQFPDYGGAFQLGVQRTISVGEMVETDETGPAPTEENRKGEELVFFGRLVYSELNGRTHATGFALRVSPYMPATVPYQNRNYDYYD
jgi:hypothetical protein